MVTYTEPSREQAEAIAANTFMVTQALTDLSGENLPPSRSGVIYLDGFINRQRGHNDEAWRDKLGNVTACYLGNALIAEIGGRWVQDADHGLGVELAPDMITYPFAKASKHFANGSEDSVLSFFDISIILANEQRGRATQG